MNAFGGSGNDTFNINGNSNSVRGEDGEDVFNIISGSSNVVNGGEGTNSITDNGTNTTATNVPGATSFSVTIKQNETKTITINNIDYEITNRGTASDLVYSIDSSNNQILFRTTQAGIEIRGDINKSHNVQLTGNVTFYGGMLNDTILANSASTIYSYSGDDNITIKDYTNVYTEDGNSTINVYGSMNLISTGNGNNTVVIKASNSRYNQIEMGSGENTLDIQGSLKYSGIYSNGSNNKLLGNISDSLISGFGKDVDNAQALILTDLNPSTIIIGGKSYTAQSVVAAGGTSVLLYNINSITDSIFNKITFL